MKQPLQRFVLDQIIYQFTVSHSVYVGKIKKIWKLLTFRSHLTSATTLNTATFPELVQDSEKRLRVAG